jgi:hypothetical protein
MPWLVISECVGKHYSFSHVYAVAGDFCFRAGCCLLPVAMATAASQCEFTFKPSECVAIMFYSVDGFALVGRPVHVLTLLSF